MLPCYRQSLADLVQMTVARLNDGETARILVFGPDFPTVAMPSLSVDTINRMNNIEVVVVSSWQDLRQTVFSWVAGPAPMGVLAVYGVVSQVVDRENLSEILMMLYHVRLNDVQVYLADDLRGDEDQTGVLEKWIVWH